MDLTFFETYLPIYFQGAGYTIGLSISAIVLGVILGTGLALMKMSPNKFLSILANGYIQIARQNGTNHCHIQCRVIHFESAGYV